MRTNRPFLICIHDATPAYASELRTILEDLGPLVGQRLSLGVVPDWHGAWPLTSHPDHCRLLAESCDEILLHGYFHQRRRGWGPTTLLTGGSDEMNGLSAGETEVALGRGQEMLAEVFGVGSRGFLAPGWQRGHAGGRREGGRPPAGGVGLEHTLGFFSLDGADGRRVPLATWSWDCGRWGWLGYVGHGLGRLLHSLHGRVPSLAIHPRDLERGYWPMVLRLTRDLLDAGYGPTTPARLLEII